jgi:hypothetical protein
MHDRYAKNVSGAVERPNIKSLVGPTERKQPVVGPDEVNELVRGLKHCYVIMIFMQEILACADINLAARSTQYPGYHKHMPK